MNDSIFNPNYQITPRISDSLAAIDRNRWLVDNLLLMPKHEARLRREVRVSRASGTTRIEGAALEDSEVALLAKQGLPSVSNEDQRANLNALQAYEFVDFLSDQLDIPVDELALRQLNRYFIAAASPALTPGAYRTGPHTGSDFQPPDHGEVPGLMKSFAAWLCVDHDGTHAIIKAGLAHLHLLALHPFRGANSSTARGLETLMLQKSEFGFRRLLALDSFLSNVKDDYLQAISSTLGLRYTPGYDATPWLEFNTIVLKICSDNLVTDTARWHRTMQEAHDVWEAKGWPRRQADAYAFAVQSGQISRSDYLEITGVSPVTASRDLAEMSKAGILIPEGKTRRRIYRPAPLEALSGIDAPDGQLPFKLD